MLPSANLSEKYENPDGETINQCQYCAFCERFACEYDAKQHRMSLLLKQLKNRITLLYVCTQT